MCELMKEIKKFSNEHSIDLTYNWRKQKEGDVDSKFKDWNGKINDILKSHEKNRGNKLYNVVDEILRWGGIYSIGETRKRFYVEKINRENCEIDNNTLLSSWTKILTAYDPDEYRIYDSRVAIALRVVAPDYAWFLPSRRNMDVIKHLKTINPDEETPKDSYDKYLSILPENQEKRAQCEKALFMLGGAVNIDMIKN